MKFTVSFTLKTVISDEIGFRGSFLRRTRWRESTEISEKSPESQFNEAYHERLKAEAEGNAEGVAEAQEKMDAAARAANARDAAGLSSELLASMTLVGFVAALAGAISTGVRRRR